MREMRGLIIYYSVHSLETTRDLTSSDDTYRTPTSTPILSWSTQTWDVRRIRMRSPSASVLKSWFCSLDAVDDWGPHTDCYEELGCFFPVRAVIISFDLWFKMPRFQFLNSTSMPNHNYEWSYEYYDDEEPVSFEGLKAHRCKSVSLQH